MIGTPRPNPWKDWSALRVSACSQTLIPMRLPFCCLYHYLCVFCEWPELCPYITYIYFHLHNICVSANILRESTVKPVGVSNLWVPDGARLMKVVFSPRFVLSLSSFYGLSLRTPWLYVGELLAREIGRLVAIEAIRTSFSKWVQMVRIEGSELYGCFQKYWYPQIIHFNRVVHYKPSILGYHYFRKHPYIVIMSVKISILKCFIVVTFIIVVEDCFLNLDTCSFQGSMRDMIRFLK